MKHIHISHIRFYAGIALELYVSMSIYKYIIHTYKIGMHSIALRNEKKIKS